MLRQKCHTVAMPPLAQANVGLLALLAVAAMVLWRLGAAYPRARDIVGLAALALAYLLTLR